MLAEMKRVTASVFFSVCAVVDFVFGCIRGHSIGSGIIAIFLGLPLTGLLFLVFRAFGSSNDDSGGRNS